MTEEARQVFELDYASMARISRLFALGAMAVLAAPKNEAIQLFEVLLREERLLAEIDGVDKYADHVGALAVMLTSIGVAMKEAQERKVLLVPHASE